jgi:hypothetical protein
MVLFLSMALQLFYFKWALKRLQTFSIILPNLIYQYKKELPLN